MGAHLGVGCLCGERCGGDSAEDYQLEAVVKEMEIGIEHGG